MWPNFLLHDLLFERQYCLRTLCYLIILGCWVTSSIYQGHPWSRCPVPTGLRSNLLLQSSDVTLLDDSGGRVGLETGSDTVLGGPHPVTFPIRGNLQDVDEPWLQRLWMVMVKFWVLILLMTTPSVQSWLRLDNLLFGITIDYLLEGL